MLPRSFRVFEDKTPASTMKKVRTDYGAFARNPPTQFLQWGALTAVVTPAVLQFILKYLSMRELLQFDTAMHSHAFIATLENAYKHGLGLESNAANEHKFSRVLDLRWVSSRGFHVQHFQLQLPSTERLHVRRSGLMQKEIITVFPTFQWLLWHHTQQTSDTGRYRDIVRLIAACGSSKQLEVCDNNGWTALTLACDLGDAEVVRLLVGRGDLRLGSSSADSDGKVQATPLERAIRCNSYACVAALISGGAVITPEALHLAIQRFGVRKLMDPPPPTNPNEESSLRERQRTIFPSRSYQLDLLQQLQLQECDRERKILEKDLEANNSLDIVRNLAQSGFCILTAVNSAGRTAIEEALHLEKPEVVAILQKAHEMNMAATDDIVAALMGLAFK